MQTKTKNDIKYTVEEIDRIRAACWLVAMKSAGALATTSIAQSTVENLLRTYMLNGTSPEEIENLVAGVVSDPIAEMARIRGRAA